MFFYVIDMVFNPLLFHILFTKFYQYFNDFTVVLILLYVAKNVLDSRRLG